MAMIRHILADNSWQIQCPECRQFVQIDLEVMEGRDPFPKHSRWAPSWVHLFAERFPRLGSAYPLYRLLTTRRMIALERFIRNRFWEPQCDFNTSYNWRSELPPTGVSALGPLEA